MTLQPHAGLYPHPGLRPGLAEAPTGPAWRPSLAQVGALLRSRTTTDAGEVGTFTTDTRPTGDGVNAIITGVINSLTSVVGGNPSSAIIPIAQDVAALGTALRIELSYFPEQVQSNRSPYEQLKALYDSTLASLINAISDADDGAIDGAAAGSGFPSWGGFDDYNSTSMTDPW